MGSGGSRLQADWLGFASILLMSFCIVLDRILERFWLGVGPVLDVQPSENLELFLGLDNRIHPNEMLAAQTADGTLGKVDDQRQERARPDRANTH